MKPRKEAVELIQRQLNNEKITDNNKTCWHYGVCELRELLDFIYESTPTENEELKYD
jgi:hypothetical protein